MSKPNLARDLLLALLPFLAGIALSLAWHFAFPPVPLLNILVDAATTLNGLLAIASLLLVVAVVSRHTSQQMLDQALNERQRAQDQAHRRFLRRLDHEIKNPLTGIKAALANLPARDEPSRSLRDIQHQVERLSRLVNDLRKLAELEEREIEHLPVDPAALLQEVVETAGASSQYGGRKLRLSISNVPWSLPSVTGDRDLLGLAFYNLVDNALKFTRPDDSIEVRAFEDGRWLIVEVADTGPGIPAEDLPRVFEELYRGSNARGFEGSGLGLSLVQRIIARHNGEVTVRSRSGQTPGGTVFAVRLPLAA
jgi:two-component system, OmpR family, sensor kinase